MAEVPSRKRPESLAIPLADLEQVYETCHGDDVSVEEAQHLSTALDEWSRRSDKELQRCLKELPPDHPVNCSISLFDTMGCSRVETAHTRFLAWLLSPGGSHGFGTVLLGSLLLQLRGGSGLRPLSETDVQTERFCPGLDGGGDGRTDIWIESRGNRGRKPWLLVIEAKVDASESDGQLGCYEAAARQWQERHGGHVLTVFLTPDGRPSTHTTDSQWQVLDFSRLVRGFSDVFPQLDGMPGYHLLRHYLAGVLKQVLDLPIGDHSEDQNRFKLVEFLGGEQQDMTIEETTMTGTNLALGFYLRYWHQMQYWYEEQDVRTRPERFGKQGKMIKRVGDCASLQGADLLRKCVIPLEKHLRDTCHCNTKFRTQPRSEQRYWFSEVQVWPKRHKRTPSRWTVGFEIDYLDGCPVLVMWIWTRGGQLAAEASARLFGEKLACRSDVHSFSRGQIAIGAPVRIRIPKTFEVDATQIISQAGKLIGRIGKEAVEEWFQIR